MKITTQRIGGIWHGYLAGHPDVDERGLTEEVARRKVERIVEKMQREAGFEVPEAEVVPFRHH